ncbi:MAG: hypothetical protein KAS49_02895 [Candidatus Cloacimonetes bacterium]|nr:hypothetical protein [Candidatus Cloacimonadota bacterium]
MKSKITWKTWLVLGFLILGFQFILLGIGLDEFPEIASKAINLCLGCIGLG